MKLIERLKKAKEGSRALDAEMAKAFGAEAKIVGRGGWRMRRPGQGWRCLPHYTDSLDDAVSLIPGHLFWMIVYGKTKEPEPLGATSIMEPGNLDNPMGQQEAATVPLSICAAVIQSLQHQQ